MLKRFLTTKSPKTPKEFLFSAFIISGLKFQVSSLSFLLSTFYFVFKAPCSLLRAFSFQLFRSQVSSLRFQVSAFPSSAFCFLLSAFPNVLSRQQLFIRPYKRDTRLRAAKMLKEINCLITGQLCDNFKASLTCFHAAVW